MIYLKFGFLFIGIMFTIVNIMRMIAKNDLPAANMIFQAIGITGFIVLQWLV